MSADHTPGPWAVRNIATGQRYIGPSSDGGAPSVALVMSRVNVPDERLTADARLIAAAPDLLEALQAIIGHDRHLLNRYRVEAAIAAITKATGGNA